MDISEEHEPQLQERQKDKVIPGVDIPDKDEWQQPKKQEDQVMPGLDIPANDEWQQPEKQSSGKQLVMELFKDREAAGRFVEIYNAHRRSQNIEKAVTMISKIEKYFDDAKNFPDEVKELMMPLQEYAETLKNYTKT